MIDCIWWDACFGNWDNGLLEEIFNKHPRIFMQHNTKSIIERDRAIVIVSGKPEIAPLKKYLETLQSGLIILVSEEDAFFRWQDAIPSHLEVATQYYFQPTKKDISIRLLMGAPTRIKEYKINTHLPKKYLWSYVGQLQNQFRQQCVEVLATLPNGFLHVTDAFGGYGKNGIEYQEYLDIMCQSKYVLCPSGSMSADSFRVYEAIECGAIPICDKRSPRDAKDFNYFDEVYPQNKLITVDEWNENTLLEIFNTNTNFNTYWWEQYKKELEQKLIRYANGNG